MESLNNGGSFANGDSMSSGNSLDGATRDYARDPQGIGMMLFPHQYQHAVNWG
jgi:hypothetical protein